MPEKSDEGDPRKATKAEVKQLLDERKARRKDPVAKREQDIARIGESAKRQREAFAKSPLEPFDTSNLDRRQREVICELEEDVRQNRHFPDEASRAELDRSIGKAVRAGIIKHPIVRDWLAARRSLGDREILRNRFRANRVERGVDGPMREEDFWVTIEGKLQAENKKGPEAIRRSLVHKLRYGILDVEFISDTPPLQFNMTAHDREQLAKRLEAMSRSGFYKLLKRLHVWPINQ